MGFRKGERWKKLMDTRLPSLEEHNLLVALKTAQIPVQFQASRLFVPYSRFGEAVAILLEHAVAGVNEAAKPLTKGESK